MLMLPYSLRSISAAVMGFSSFCIGASFTSADICGTITSDICGTITSDICGVGFFGCGYLLFFAIGFDC